MEEVNYAFAVSEFTETIDSARVFLRVPLASDNYREITYDMQSVKYKHE